MKAATETLGLVHKFVASPGSADSPTLLLLHGTGGDENDLFPLGKSLLPEANLLSPRGAVNENGMNRFFRRFSEGVFDIDDIKNRAQELARFIELSSFAYGFELNRLYAIGFSNGANMAASLLLLFPRLLAGAVLFRPMVPLIPETLPDLSLVSILVLPGQRDQVVPEGEPTRLANLLKASGANISIDWQNAGHNLISEEIQSASAWLRDIIAANDERQAGDLPIQ